MHCCYSASQELALRPHILSYPIGIAQDGPKKPRFPNHLWKLCQGAVEVDHVKIQSTWRFLPFALLKNTMDRAMWFPWMRMRMKTAMWFRDRIPCSTISTGKFTKQVGKLTSGNFIPRGTQHGKQLHSANWIGQERRLVPAVLNCKTSGVKTRHPGANVTAI